MKWSWSNYTEPARIRAAVAAILALCGALGIVLPFDLPGIAEALILIFAVVFPVAQGESTRAAVYSPRTKDVLVGQASAGLTNGPA